MSHACSYLSYGHAVSIAYTLAGYTGDSTVYSTATAILERLVTIQPHDVSLDVFDALISAETAYNTGEHALLRAEVRLARGLLFSDAGESIAAVRAIAREAL